MDKQDHRKTNILSGHESPSIHVCRKCGWPFPNPHPSARLRRGHKRICGTIEGYKLVDSEENALSNHSSDEHLSDEDQKSHSPKFFEAIEKPSGRTEEISNRVEDDVFSDAAAEFTDSGSGVGTGQQLRNAQEPLNDDENILKNETNSIKNDPIAETSIPLSNATDNCPETPGVASNQLRTEPEFQEPPSSFTFTTTSSVVDSITGGSPPLLLGGKNRLMDNLYPFKSEIQKEALEENDNATNDVANRFLVSVGQVSDLNERKETDDFGSNLPDEMISPKIADETAEAVDKFEEPVKRNSEPLAAVPAMPAYSVVQSQKEHIEGFPGATSNQLRTELEFQEPPSTFTFSTTSSVSDSISEDSSPLLLGDKNGLTDDLYPLKYEIQKEASDENEKANAATDVATGSLISVGQENDLNERKETDLGSNIPDEMISPSKIADETTEAVDKLEETVTITSESLPALPPDSVIQSQEEHIEGFQVKIPQTDLPLQVESVKHGNASVDIVETMVDSTEEIKFVNSGDLIETGNTKEEGNENFHVLSVPDDIHVVDQPEIMIEDFKDHHGVKLYQSATLESCEPIMDNGESVEGPVSEATFLDLESSQLSEGDVVLEDNTQPDQESSIPVVREVALEEEANSSQINIKISENQRLDDIVTPDHAVVAQIDKSFSFGIPELESYDNKGTKEHNHTDSKSTPESNLSEIQVNPATDLQEGDGYETKVESRKDDITRDFGNDVAEHVKAETGDDNSSRFKEYNLQEGHETGNNGNGEIEMNDKIGDVGYDAVVHVNDQNRNYMDSEPKDETENPIISPESDRKISELQDNPATNLSEGDDANDCEKGIIEKFVKDESQSRDGHAEENLLEKQTTLTISASNLLKSQTVVEDVADESMEKLPEIGYTDKSSASDSSKVVTDTVFGTQLVSDTQIGILEHNVDDKEQEDVVVSSVAVSDSGLDAMPLQNTLESHVIKEQDLSSLGADSSIQDNHARDFSGATSGLSSQPLKEDRQQVGPFAVDVSVDSSSQTDSLEGHWGSVSVLSTQSDAQAIIDAEALPPAGSQGTRGEIHSKQPKAASGREHPDKSEMFEPPSFMTLVESGGGRDEKATDSEIQTVQNPQQSNSSPLQAGWFPSLTHVVNESQGRKKNEEIIAKVTNWSTGKQHTPLKNLLNEASLERKPRSPTPKENQKGDKAAKDSVPVAKTGNSILDPLSPASKIASQEAGKEWDSPARYLSDINMEKRKEKRKPYWVQFVCCSSVN